MLKSTVARAKPLDLSPVVVKEITVVGSRCGPFDRAITALAHGDIDVLSLVAARYPLTDALRALELAQNGHCLKVLLDVSEAPQEGATPLHSL